MSRGVLVLAILWLGVLAGCASPPAAPVSPDPGGPQPSSSFATVRVPGLVCSNGTDWAFFVSRGDPGKVLINFQGGGACWNNETCNPGSGPMPYTPGLNSFELLQGQGIFDRSNRDNPFYGWTHVFVPYCTGDVHWGDATVTYGSRTVRHKGAVNSRAALDYTFANFPAPQQAAVTGCSAGAYGAALWSAYVMRQYPNSRVRLWADAGVGVVTDSFASTGFKSWKAEQAIPDFIPELAPARSDASRIRLTDLYRAIAKQYPNARLSQYTTQSDFVQTGFYSLMGGDSSNWPSLAQSSLSNIKQSSANFSSFVAPGSDHCISVSNGFYTAQVGNSKLSDWVKALVDGNQPGDVRP